MAEDVLVCVPVRVKELFCFWVGHVSGAEINVQSFFYVFNFFVALDFCYNACGADNGEAFVRMVSAENCGFARESFLDVCGVCFDVWAGAVYVCFVWLEFVKQGYGVVCFEPVEVRVRVIECVVNVLWAEFGNDVFFRDFEDVLFCVVALCGSEEFTVFDAVVFEVRFVFFVNDEADHDEGTDDGAFSGFFYAANECHVKNIHVLV